MLSRFEHNEKVFFAVLDDLSEYVESLVIVGGWVPYIYAKYIWEDPHPAIVTTSDIDLGIHPIKKSYPICSGY